jgi:uncharacterized membrane protein
LSSSTRVIARSLLTLILIFGGLLVFLTPPIQSADEDSHLKRSVMVADFRLATRMEGDSYGQDVPKSLIDYVDSHRSMIFKADQRYSYQRWVADTHAPSPPKETVFHSYTGQSLSPLYYAPQATGIWVGKILYAIAPVEFNWSAAQYFARLGNLVAYALVFAWAIGAAPRFAGILSFIAMTPMALSLGASASYDVTVILAAVGFFAAAIRAADRKEGPNRKDLVLLLLLAFMLGQSKAVYSPVMTTVFLLIGRMDLRRFLVFAAACGAAAIAGMALSSVIFGLPQQPALQAAVDGQMAYVASNLAKMPGLVLASIYHFRDFHFVSSFGNLGWLDTNFAIPVLVAWLGVGLWAIYSDSRGIQGPGRLASAGYVLAGVAVSLFALFLAMYVTWTSITTGVGGPLIDSVQGRYLLPLAPFVMAAAAILVSFVVAKPDDMGRWRRLRLQHTLSWVMGGVTVFVILARYWIPAPAVSGG